MFSPANVFRYTVIVIGTNYYKNYKSALQRVAIFCDILHIQYY